MQYLFLAMSFWLGHYSLSHLQPAQTSNLLRAQLTLAQAALALPHLKILKKHCWHSCPLALGVGCGPHVHQCHPMESWEEGGSFGDCLVVKWIPLDHCVREWLAVLRGALGLLPGLQGNWGYQFGSSSPSRTCDMEHMPLPQPLQHKVRALGFKTSFISSSSWVPGCGLERLGGRPAPFC